MNSNKRANPKRAITPSTAGGSGLKKYYKKTFGGPKPGDHKRPPASPTQSAWFGLPEKHRETLRLFGLEFGYLVGAGDHQNLIIEDNVAWIKINNMILDLPLLKEEWYSFINKTKPTEIGELMLR